MRRIPIKTQIVSVAVASFFQESGDQGTPARSLPVMNVTLDDSSRCVSGMPAYVAAPTGDDTAGTISNSIPASTSASASSAPRANRSGSPPFSRTTRLPARASSMSSALMASWAELGSPKRFPTLRRSASARHTSRKAGWASAS
jgi:hypothetical protein